MAGFYIHIPLCRKVCYYCDFHFVASMKYKDELVSSLLMEIKNRSTEWQDSEFDTIYFGGGTPSVLAISEINRIVECIYKYYNISSEIEFTLEANPDDLTRDYLKQLKHDTNINRLSIGIQSFHDRDLKLMNRRHDGVQAIDCIRNAKENGFENLTIDLIYGIPGLSLSAWEDNVTIFLDLDLPHLAAYHLSIEPKTVFGVFQSRKKFEPIREGLSVEHYDFLNQALKGADYEHYEVSNFAKNRLYSKHNTGYWLGEKYIGIGPSAHSFNGEQRRWNISNNTKYCDCINRRTMDYFEVEELSCRDRFNDYLLTSLRTVWGANLEHIHTEFGERFAIHCSGMISKYLAKGLIEKRNQNFRITENGWFISDSILTEFIVEN